ncbi:hypothetical protein BCR35DRAFT_351678 [Leucosporidium creatinivorum]|uniref:GAF domain-containing protein n=1 Tax=Leucosporidium creatinivorum TaxID=106004 RepID=A0A1Y2FMY8_9BASI|nr:hypothetical protein BCR35DRAFT_351678 [Leucosporidium creatinivorum]
MAPTSPKPEQDRRGSAGSIKTFVRRFSLPRRESYDKKAAAAASAAAAQGRRGSKSPTSPLSPVVDEMEAAPLSPVTSLSEVSSWGAPVQKLNSMSPASELPTTWAEWNDLYARGMIDFNDPPPPPQTLYNSPEQHTSTGQYRAPTPLDEAARQRSIDAIALLNHSRKRRASGEAPHTIHGALSDAESICSSDTQSSISTAPSSVTSEPPIKPTDAGLLPPYPKELSTHPKLLKLAQDAKRRFSTNGSTVSLMDGDYQVFLAEEGFGVDELPRESTVCSHTQLKASATGEKDPLVVLDLAKDWRFSKNNFGQYTGGFYAAAPIMLPAPLGDDAGSYPAGIFCIIDDKPRPSFSAEDRAHLEEMADLAGAEILRVSQEQQEKKKVELKKNREAWKKSKLVRRVSEKSALETVEEVSTPPASPALIGIEDSMRSLGSAVDGDEGLGSYTMDQTASSSGGGSNHDHNEERRGSLPESLPDTVSEASSQELGVTEVPPTSGKTKGRNGVHAGSHRLSPEMKSMLDLSTQLVGESLDLDFCYVVAIELPSSHATPRTTSEKPITLLSGHNVPMPAPLFDIDLHMETLTSSHNAILFTNPEFSGADGEFSCGLLVKIAIADGVGYVLAAYSENERRVLSDADYSFMKSFARDLSQWVKKL